MATQTILVKLEACGFCGAQSGPCREFGENVRDHEERFVELPELFTFELDGITAETAADAYEMEWQYEQYLQEEAAENGWLRAAENNPSVGWEPTYF